MKKVVEVRDLDNYVETTKDANWRFGMEEEMRALNANDTWDLVDPPQNCKPIRCKWVYKVKYNADGLVNGYKA